MKILSWNINGIRAAIKKGFIDYINNENFDIICLQEVKIAEAAKIKEEISFLGFTEYWNSAERPGYSGTLMLARGKTDYRYMKGFNIDKFDIEGRCQTLELPKFYLLNCYFPNANNALSRLDHKIEFDNELLKYMKKLEKKKPVVLCGDYNVAHNEIDLARPKPNVGKPGFTAEERAWMNKFIEAGFIDTYRAINGDKIQYSWWSYRANARANNVGWRLDYFCVSSSFKKKIKNAFILDKVMGSDHCPVGIEL
jgi:exodeoxyribonuclease III